MKHLKLGYITVPKKGFVSLMILVILHVMMSMLNYSITLIHNFKNLAEQQKEIIELKNDFNEEILELYRSVDELDICNHFPYQKEKNINGKVYHFKFSEEGELVSVNIFE